MGKGLENFTPTDSSIEARLTPENLERVFNAYRTDDHLAAFLAYAISGKYDFKPMLTISNVENFYTSFPTLKVFREKFNPGLFIDIMSQRDKQGRISRKDEAKDFDKYTAYQGGGERFVELMYPGEM